MTRGGLHVNANLAHDKAVAYCRDVQPALMKWLEPSRETLQECKRVSPGTKHIIRVFDPDQNLAAGRYVPFRSRCVEKAREFAGLVSFVEGWNEVACNDPRYVRDFMQHEVDLAHRLNDAGCGALIGGFSTGSFDAGGYTAAELRAAWGDAPLSLGASQLVVPFRLSRGRVAWTTVAGATAMYDAVRPALEFLHQTGETNGLHFHEYSAPYIQHGWRTADGLNQWDHGRNCWTGASTDPAQYARAGIDGWWTLRYRMLRRLLVRDGLTDVRFAITESGLDDIQPRPGGQGKGWRDWDRPEWTGLPGVGDFASQNRAYGEHITADGFVLGWVDFGFGTADHAWDSFAMDQTPAMLARMVTEMKRLPVSGVVPIPAPGPDPVPVVTGVVPAVQVLRGEGLFAILRRIGVQPSAANVKALRDANKGADVLHAGQFLVSPFHTVRPK